MSKLALINPPAKMMFVSKNVDEVLAETVFTKAFKMHKILRLILIDTVNGCYYLYNPFKKLIITFDVSKPIDFVAFNRNRVLNLHQFKLLFNAFPSPSYCKISKDRTKFSWMCNEILRTFQKFMNISTEYVEPLSGWNYGSDLLNGSYTGGIRELEEQRVNFSTTIRGFAFLVNATQLMMLVPTISLRFCFVVPNDFYQPPVKIFQFEFFDALTCMFIGICFAMIVIFTYVLMYFTTKDEVGLEKLFFIFYAMSVNISVVNLPKSSIFRTMAALVLIVFLILNSSYQGLIITALNINKGRNLQTMEELLTNNFTIFIPLNLDRFIIGLRSSPKGSINRRVYEKGIPSPIESRPEAKRVAEKRDAAVLIPDFYFETYKTEHLNPKTGRSLVHMLADCPSKYYLGPATQRNSPFTERYNEILLRLNEAGYTDYQIEAARADIGLAYIRQAKSGNLEELTVKMISMEELWFLFMIYGFMIASSAVVLFIEMIFDWLLPFARAAVQKLVFNKGKDVEHETKKGKKCVHCNKSF